MCKSCKSFLYIFISKNGNNSSKLPLKHNTLLHISSVLWKNWEGTFRRFYAEYEAVNGTLVGPHVQDKSKGGV